MGREEQPPLGGQLPYSNRPPELGGVGMRKLGGFRLPAVRCVLRTDAHHLSKAARQFVRSRRDPG